PPRTQTKASPWTTTTAPSKPCTARRPPSGGPLAANPCREGRRGAAAPSGTCTDAAPPPGPCEHVGRDARSSPGVGQTFGSQGDKWGEPQGFGLINGTLARAARGGLRW